MLSQTSRSQAIFQKTFIYFVGVTEVALRGIFIGNLIYADPGVAIGAVLGAIVGCFRTNRRLASGEGLRTKERFVGILVATIAFPIVLCALTLPALFLNSEIDRNRSVSSVDQTSVHGTKEQVAQIENKNIDPTRIYTKCESRVDAEGTTCVLSELREKDAALNKNYRNLIAKLSGKEKRQLKREERAWRKRRDNFCQQPKEVKVFTDYRFAECMLAETVKRLAEMIFRINK